MENLNEKKNIGYARNRESAITLISLVVTIIILLILAGVTMNMIISENGIIQKATISKEETQKASIEEKLSLAMTEVQLEKGEALTIEDFIQKILDNNIVEKENIVKINNDSAIKIVLKEGYIFKATLDKIEYMGMETSPILDTEITNKGETATITITSDVTNRYALQNYKPTGTWNGGIVEDVSTTEPGPIQTAKTWKLVKTGTKRQWQGFQATLPGLFPINKDDLFIVSGYYKTTSNAGIKTIRTSGMYWDWNYNLLTLMEYNNIIIPDGQWRYFYSMFKAKENIIEPAILDGPMWDYSVEAGEMYINGLNWKVVPSTNTTAKDIHVIKYEKGKQTLEYFQNNGGIYANGNQITVTENGIYTIYVQDLLGNGTIKTINVNGIG